MTINGTRTTIIEQMCSTKSRSLKSCVRARFFGLDGMNNYGNTMKWIDALMIPVAIEIGFTLQELQKANLEKLQIGHEAFFMLLFKSESERFIMLRSRPRFNQTCNWRQSPTCWMEVTYSQPEQMEAQRALVEYLEISGQSRFASFASTHRLLCPSYIDLPVMAEFHLRGVKNSSWICTKRC